MKKFLSFLISKRLLLNIALIIGVWILIIFLESWYLSKHTNHGEKIKVPEFYKIHQDDLDEFISGKGISYEIQDSVFIDGWPKGTVCWQYPRPTDSTGTYVKKGRVIKLSVVPSHPKMICMTKVVDASKRMAESHLSAMGLRTKITFEPSPDLDEGYVMKQLYRNEPIDSGTFVPKGSRIELIVAQKINNELSTLPNLIGLTINEAKQRLGNLPLRLTENCDNCTEVSDYPDAVIVNQLPLGGDSVEIAAGAEIRVWAQKK